jgi:hypothetical protein
MAATTPFSAHPDGTVVALWVVPGASRSEIAGRYGGALRIRIAAPPEGGKANRAVAKLLRDATGARSVDLLRGAASRRKQVLLVGVAPSEAERLLTK